MFLDELSPIVKELCMQPLAFTGGFFSGLLHLSLSEDPLKSWLDQQTGKTTSDSLGARIDENGKGDGPQRIVID